VRVCVFLDGWESALDSVDLMNLDSSLLLERSFLVTERWIPETLGALLAPWAW
jgi:hypothetical protein